MACREEHGIKKVEKGETGRNEWGSVGAGKAADTTAFRSKRKKEEDGEESDGGVLHV